MKSVLIVDDEKPFLESVKLGFQTHESDFKLFTAENGQAAIDLLEAHTIDIIVTDVKMPVMDGFELLAYISNMYPSLPVIVMSAYADAAMQKKFMRMGALGLLEKPLDFDDLAAMVTKWLQMTNQNAPLSGISLESFLQLIQLEQTTYLLKVCPRDQQAEDVGFIYAFNGELYDAIYGELRGEKAVFEILKWDHPRIVVQKSPPQKFKRNIQKSIMSILLEASAEKDEAQDESQANDRADKQAAEVSEDAHEMAPISAHPDASAINRLPERGVLEKTLNMLQGIQGCKASALVLHSGEIIASDVADASIDIEHLIERFNTLLNQAHETCETSGFESVNDLIISASHHKVVMLCSGVDSKVHFHVMAVATTDCDIEILDLSLRKIISKIKRKL